MFDLQIKIGQPHGGIAEGAEGAPWLLSKCRGRAVCPVSLLDFLLNLFFCFFWFPIPSLLALPCGTQTVSEHVCAGAGLYPVSVSRHTPTVSFAPW
jgi:hypothetical protein